MIKNDRQYRVTQSEARRFEEALSRLRIEGEGRDWWDVEIAAIESQLDSLRAEINEYEDLRRAQPRTIVVDHLSDLPAGLIKARIATGLSQKELADRLGLKAQMVQRYEATDYSSASFSRLLEVAQALEVEVRNELTLSGAGLDDKNLLSRLKAAGISTALIERRLAPLHKSDARSRLETIEMAERVFGADLSGTAETGSFQGEEVLQAANFKLPARFNEPQLKSYTMYAYYLARLALSATPNLQARGDLPSTAADLRAALADNDAPPFSATLKFLWSSGVVVLPLADPGAFHGAYWRLEGRDVIVLKQMARSEARWHFDLLHEYYHLIRTTERTRMVLDADETGPGLGLADAEEEEGANRFAGAVLLAGRAEEFAAEVVKSAGGRMERLKSAVSTVALQHRIDAATLANYMAWRLSLQGENWWATAASMQRQEGDPWEVARDEFLCRVDIDPLDDLDRQILIRALQEVK